MHASADRRSAPRAWLLAAVVAAGCTSIPEPADLEPIGNRERDARAGDVEAGPHCPSALAETAFPGAAITFAQGPSPGAGAWHMLVALQLTAPSRFALLEVYVVGHASKLRGQRHSLTPRDLDPETATFWTSFGDRCSRETLQCASGFFAAESGFVAVQRAGTELGDTVEFLWRSVVLRAAAIDRRTRRASLVADGDCVVLDRVAVIGTVQDVSADCGRPAEPLVCTLARRAR